MGRAPADAEAVEVVVLLAMPSPERARARRVRAKAAEARDGSVGSGASRESETGKARATDDVRAVMEEGPDGVLGEYVIGCARVRWEEGKAEEATSVS